MVATINNGTTSPFHWRREKPPSPYAGLVKLVSNIYSMRTQLLQRLIDPRRDLDQDCGYPKPGEMNPKKYKDLFDREPYANRVVRVLPEESWQVQPSIVESKNTKEQTYFEKVLLTLTKNLKGERSFHKQEEGSALWEYLLRADILSGIGEFGIILLGVEDFKPLNQPLDGVMTMPDTTSLGVDEQYFQKTRSTEEPDESDSSPEDTSSDGVDVTPLRRLLYLRVFPQSSVSVTQYEQNEFSPRFGKPVMYQVNTIDPNSTVQGTRPVGKTLMVHWTRIIHIADNVESDEGIGKPRMEPVLNPLLDIRKVRGGSAEMYWLAALPGLSIESIPQLGAEVMVDEDELRDMMELYQNSLQRFIALYGMQAKSLSPQVSDPTQQIAVQEAAICIQMAIPIPVFRGYEIGEQASTNNYVDWKNRVRSRRLYYINPKIICPLIDRLISCKCLPVPVDGYKVEWPDIATQTAIEKAQVAATKTTAMSTYVAGGVEMMMSVMDFLTRIMDFSEEDAKEIIDNAINAQGDTMTDPHPPTEPQQGNGGKPMTDEEGNPVGEDQKAQGEGDSFDKAQLRSSYSAKPSLNMLKDLFTHDVANEGMVNNEYNKSLVNMAEQLKKLGEDISVKYDRILARYEALDNRLNSLTNNQQQPPIHIYNNPPQNTVNLPDIKVDNHFTSPENPTINVHIPDSKPPVINNVVNVPEQPTPIVKNDITVSSPEINQVKLVQEEPLRVVHEDGVKTVEVIGPDGKSYKGTVTNDNNER